MKTDLTKMFAADAEQPVANNTELQEISKLAQDQLDWENRIKQLETDIDHAKEALRNIQEHLLPEALLSVGMSEFKLANGYKITVKEDVYASIRKDFMNQAVEWLDANGLGGIVKDQVAVDFGRGEFDNVAELLAFCSENGLNACEKLSVHPMTLKGTVKEMMGKGVEFPEEFFSTGPLRKAIIKTR